MVLRNRLLAAAGTVFVAIVAGQFVQTGDKLVESARKTAPERVSPYALRDVTQLSTGSAADLPVTNLDVPALPKAPAAPRQMPPLPTPRGISERLEALDDQQQSPDPQQLNAFGMPCETALNASAEPGAMVRLSLRASCQGGRSIAFSQDRLRFSYRLPESGELELLVPALSTLPVFVAELPDGSLLTTPVQVPQAAAYQRVALQWQGATGFELHAYEFGAKFGERGHVWAGAARDTAFAIEGRGGYLSTLGEAQTGWTAQVYSFPADHDARGTVRLNVETEVTDSNCGQQVLAETLQPGPDGAMQSAELSMQVPGCDAKGEFLVLKNILRDLKIAQN